jgi:hypothetical protein
MKAHHDKKQCSMEFEVGEWVWLRLHHRSVVGITPLRPKTSFLRDSSDRIEY